MARIVLLHGSHAGDWSWYRLIPELEALDHTPTALTMKRHTFTGTDRQVATVADYMAQLVDHLGGFSEPAFLVADNVAGVWANETAERHPDRVAGLIYLSGLFAAPGDVHPPLYSDSFARDARRIIQMGQMQVLRPEMVVDLFYHDCDDETIARVTGRDVEEIADFGPPLLGRPVKYWPGMPKAYVYTARSRGVTPEQQRDIIRQYRIENVVEMDTGACPHLSAPELLASHISQLIEEMSGGIGNHS